MKVAQFLPQLVLAIMSRRAVIEAFEELRDPQNPKVGNRLGLGIKVTIALCVLLALIFGIVVLVKLESLTKDRDAFVAEMQEVRGEIESYTPYKNYPVERLVQLLIKGKPHKFSQIHINCQLNQSDEELKGLPFNVFMRIVLAATVPDSQKKPARVPRRKVYTALNNSEIFSCETSGQPINSCLWGRTLKSQWQVIIIDGQQTDQDGGWTYAEGLLYNGEGLKEGKCSVKIESVTDQDFGSWSCTLVSDGGAIFRGEVSIVVSTSKSV